MDRQKNLYLPGNHTIIYGNLHWRTSDKNKWNCEHVSKVDCLIEGPDGMYNHNTDYPRPPFDYFKWIYVIDLLIMLEIDYKVRRPLEDCDCKPD